MKKVLIPTKLQAVAREILEENGGYEVVQDESAQLADLAAAHPDTYAMFVRSEKVTAEIFDALPALKVVIRAGAGYNTIDTKEARKRHIDVMNTPGANANAVAEEVVAMMLADARHIVAADPSARSGKWEKKNFMGREISHKTVGIIGLGAIGKLVIKRLFGFDMEVIGYDPLVTEDRAREHGVELVDLPELFSRADYISLHLPENDETRNMIDKSLLSLMKDGATLINCARSGILNEEDLRDVKKEKSVRFLNDVYPADEEGPKSVADVANLMLPHLGASTKEANTNAARRAAIQLIEFDNKGITTYIVNRNIPEGLDEVFASLAHTLTNLCRHVAGREHTLTSIKTSFYGTLQPYAEWLVVPVAVALNEDFDRSLDYLAALEYFKKRGIEYETRETDTRKGFENSITVDITVTTKSGQVRQGSVRGTIAEGTRMVSRINDFDKLYFEPQGQTIIFAYPDRPGVLGKIGASLAEVGINIDDVRQPHDSKGENSIAILKVNQCCPEPVLNKIKGEIDATIAFCLELK